MRERLYHLKCGNKPSVDHPRSCGKDDAFQYLFTKLIGSPPLVRERRVQKSYCVFLVGITPARAGKTWVQAFSKLYIGDHPRSCGKDPAGYHRCHRRRGSPPLVRERQPFMFLAVECSGITPARAGKTRPRCTPPGTLRDHPRSCGKDRPLPDGTETLTGSPPLVRERLS